MKCSLTESQVIYTNGVQYSPETDGFAKASIGNLGDRTIDVTVGSITTDIISIQLVVGICNLLGILWFYALYIYLKNRQKAYIAEIDEDTITLGDYSIMVSAIPKDATDPDELQTYFARYGEVADIAIALNNGDLLRKFKERGVRESQLEQSLAKLNRDKLSTQVGPVEKNRKKLADIDKQILSKRQDTDFKSVMAFVTFNEDEAVNNCLIEFSRKGFGRRTKRFRGRKHLVVDPAPEPDTLLWENLEYDARNRSFRRFMGRAISVLSLSVGFGVIVASKGLQEFFSSEGTGGSFCDVQREIDPRGFREFQVERLLWLKHTLDYARYMAYLNCYCEVIVMNMLLVGSG